MMNIAEVLEQALAQESDLDKDDWHFLHYQCQVLYQVLVSDSRICIRDAIAMF